MESEFKETEPLTEPVTAPVSQPIQCNIATDKLSDAEISRIETQCKVQHHIAETASLRDQIKADEEVVFRYGFTFEQLGNFFEKIKAHYSCTEKEVDIKDVLSGDVIEKLKKFKIGGPGWCCWGSGKKMIFGNQIFVFKITWGGAEECPFQSPEDKRYNGYKYGSHDWVFANLATNEVMHIGDLLFHQIAEHHFFQGPESKYRVDPEQLIKFFGLKNNLTYETEKESFWYWSISSITSSVRKDSPDKEYSPHTADNILVKLPEKYKRTVYGRNIVIEYANEHGDELVIYKNERYNIPSIIGDALLHEREFCDYSDKDEYYIGIYHYMKCQSNRTTDNEMKFIL